MSPKRSFEEGAQVRSLIKSLANDLLKSPPKSTRRSELDKVLDQLDKKPSSEKVLKMRDCPKCGHTVMEPSTKCGYCGKTLGTWWTSEGTGLTEYAQRRLKEAMKGRSVAAWAAESINEAVSSVMMGPYPMGMHMTGTRGPATEQLPTQMGSEPGKLAHDQIHCDRCGGQGCQECNYYGHKARGVNSHEDAPYPVAGRREVGVDHPDVRKSLEKSLDNLQFAHSMTGHPEVYKAVQTIRRLLKPKSNFNMDA